MIIAIDVYYKNEKAKAVSIEFDQWKDEKPRKINTAVIEGIAEYVPGEFYKRELPCILEILKQSDLSKTKAIIVDGYVVLDDNGKAGLGMYLYEALDKKIPIIGVAKTSFHNNQKLVKGILRGTSKKPIYVSAVGLPLAESAMQVQQMYGDFRMPTLLSILDQHTKDFK